MPVPERALAGSPICSSKSQRTLPADEVRYVEIVLLADVLHQLAVIEDRADGERPRLGIRLQIVDGLLDFKMALVNAMEPLDHMKRFGRRQSCAVDPNLPLKPTVSTTSVSPSPISLRSASRPNREIQSSVGCST
jgi:hypothetical protein